MFEEMKDKIIEMNKQQETVESDQSWIATKKNCCK